MLKGDYQHSGFIFINLPALACNKVHLKPTLTAPPHTHTYTPHTHCNTPYTHTYTPHLTPFILHTLPPWFYTKLNHLKHVNCLQI